MSPSSCTQVVENERSVALLDSAECEPQDGESELSAAVHLFHVRADNVIEWHWPGLLSDYMPALHCM